MDKAGLPSSICMFFLPLSNLSCLEPARWPYSSGKGPYKCVFLKTLFIHEAETKSNRDDFLSVISLYSFQDRCLHETIDNQWNGSL